MARLNAGFEKSERKNGKLRSAIKSKHLAMGSVEPKREG